MHWSLNRHCSKSDTIIGWLRYVITVMGDEGSGLINKAKTASSSWNSPVAHILLAAGREIAVAGTVKTGRVSAITVKRDTMANCCTATKALVLLLKVTHTTQAPQNRR
jgi:hypothetical protein